MTYSKDKVPIYSSQVWYDRLAKNYKKYHKDLDSWDNWLFVRFLPRDLQDMSVLDLWCWDGRLSKHFKNKWISKYVGCDISPNMLKRADNWMQKVVCDIEEWLNFEKDSFDLVLGFFVLLHIQDLEKLFDEVYKVLKVGWRFIVLHHIERRNTFEWDNQTFKIITYNHRYENLEKIAYKAFFQIDYLDLIQDWTLIGKLYCFTKN